MPLPAVLRFNTDRLRRQQLQHQVDALQKEVSALKQQLANSAAITAAAATSAAPPPEARPPHAAEPMPAGVGGSGRAAGQAAGVHRRDPSLVDWHGASPRGSAAAATAAAASAAAAGATFPVATPAGAGGKGAAAAPASGLSNLAPHNARAQPAGSWPSGSSAPAAAGEQPPAIQLEQPRALSLESEASEGALSGSLSAEGSAASLAAPHAPGGGAGSASLPGDGAAAAAAGQGRGSGLPLSGTSKPIGRSPEDAASAAVPIPAAGSRAGSHAGSQGSSGPLARSWDSRSSADRQLPKGLASSPVFPVAANRSPVLGGGLVSGAGRPRDIAGEHG